MMDVADRHGVTLTFFLDEVEESIYPGQIEEVAQHIAARGHDLELHAHPEVGSDAFWADLGFKKRLQNTFDRDQAAALFGEIQRMTADWGVPAPIAYRAGAYRYSPGILEAMADFGLDYSFNYNMWGHSQADSNIGILPVFSWQNGVIEVPMSFVSPVNSFALLRFNDLLYSVYGDNAAYAAADRFKLRWGGKNVLIFMMHSWSLLNTDGQYFTYDDDSRVKAFDQFLAGLPPDVVVVSVRQLDALLRDGAFRVDSTENIDDIFH